MQLYSTVLRDSMEEYNIWRKYKSIKIQSVLNIKYAPPYIYRGKKWGENKYKRMKSICISREKERQQFEYIETNRCEVIYEVCLKNKTDITDNLFQFDATNMDFQSNPPRVSWIFLSFFFCYSSMRFRNDSSEMTFSSVVTAFIMDATPANCTSLGLGEKKWNTEQDLMNRVID